MAIPLFRPASPETLERFATGAKSVAEAGFQSSGGLKGDFPVLTLHELNSSRNPEVPETKALFSISFPSRGESGILLRLGLAPVTSLIAGLTPDTDQTEPEEVFRILRFRAFNPMSLLNAEGNPTRFKHRVGDSYYLEFERLSADEDRISFAKFSTTEKGENPLIFSYKIPERADSLEDVYPKCAAEQELRFAIDMISGFNKLFASVANQMRKAKLTVYSNELRI